MLYFFRTILAVEMLLRKLFFIILGKKNAISVTKYSQIPKTAYIALFHFACFVGS